MQGKSFEHFIKERGEYFKNTKNKDRFYFDELKKFSEITQNAFPREYREAIREIGLDKDIDRWRMFTEKKLDLIDKFQLTGNALNIWEGGVMTAHPLYKADDYLKSKGLEASSGNYFLVLGALTKGVVFEWFQFYHTSIVKNPLLI